MKFSNDSEARIQAHLEAARECDRTYELLDTAEAAEALRRMEEASKK